MGEDIPDATRPSGIGEKMCDRSDLEMALMREGEWLTRLCHLWGEMANPPRPPSPACEPQSPGCWRGGDPHSKSQLELRTALSPGGINQDKPLSFVQGPEAM